MSNKFSLNITLYSAHAQFIFKYHCYKILFILQTSDYLHYSDCECAVGDRRQELCYAYTVGKHAGWGILSVLLGILTSCLIYFFIFYVIDKLRDMCCDKSNKDLTKTEIPEETDTSSIDNDVETINEPENPSPLKELTSPTKRKHHCWACEVKYNNAQPPVFYSREHRFHKY